MHVVRSYPGTSRGGLGKHEWLRERSDKYLEEIWVGRRVYSSMCGALLGALARLGLGLSLMLFRRLGHHQQGARLLRFPPSYYNFSRSSWPLVY